MLIKNADGSITVGYLPNEDKKPAEKPSPQVEKKPTTKKKQK